MANSTARGASRASASSPLVEPQQPVVAVDLRLCSTTQPMVLRVRTIIPRMKLSVTDVRSGEELFQIRSPLIGLTQTLHGRDGSALVCLQSHLLSSGFTVLQGDQALATVTVETTTTMGVQQMCVAFQDVTTHQPSRLVVQGKWSERDALVYLERGSDDRRATARAAAFELDQPYVEIAPNVDVALVLMVHLARWTLFMRAPNA